MTQAPRPEPEPEPEPEEEMPPPPDEPKPRPKPKPEPRKTVPTTQVEKTTPLARAPTFKIGQHDAAFGVPHAIGDDLDGAKVGGVADGDRAAKSQTAFTGVLAEIEQ